ncbi:hypothetical protein [Roseibium sp. MMSF_3544]|nr:hypothetical protein [Roseibium sp. MMSF_3544]
MFGFVNVVNATLRETTRTSDAGSTKTVSLATARHDKAKAKR